MQFRQLTLGAAFVLASVGVGSAQQMDMKKPDPKTPAATPMQAPTAAQATPPAFDKAVARRMDSTELKKRIDAGEKVIVLDTRSHFTGPKAKGALLVNLEKLDGWAKDVPKDSLIVAYCT